MTFLPGRTVVLRGRIRLPVGATIAYNVVEAVVALAAGTIASSVALVGSVSTPWAVHGTRPTPASSRGARR